MRRANEGGPQTEFLREACLVVLRTARSDRVELWLEDEDLRCCWRAEKGPGRDFRLMKLARDALAPRSERRWLGGVVAIPFQVDGRNNGVLRLERTSRAPFTREEVVAYESLAQLLGVATANRRAHAALNERVKELTCMYRIAHVAAEPSRPLDATLQEVVELLPPAWQFPQVTSARITHGEDVFRSTGFVEGPHRLRADIVVRGRLCGLVEVFCRDSGPTDLKGAPFLPEEQHLIDGVAREVAFMIERRFAEREESRLQEQLRHADRLATIGQLAAGVAHELNEPLGNILGFAQLAGKSAGLAEQPARDIERIVTAALYAREIIKKLMFFARQTPPRRQEVSLNEVVSEVLSLLKSRCADSRVDVEHELSPSLRRVLGDPAQLQQVLVNLLVNAVQAMPDGGRLLLRTWNEGEVVSITVEDTGVGIAPEQLESVFVPFFTTKEVGEGTGLGLAVVHGIVTAHGGSVRVRSEPGRGTCFEVQLPAASVRAAEESDAVG